VAAFRITALTASSMAAFAIFAISAVYPILVYLGLRQGIAPRWLALGMLALLALRWGRTLLRKIPLPFALATVAAALALAWFRGAASVLYYPVGVNLALLIVFAASLRFPPPVIERLARLRHPYLDEHGVRYTRKVTVVWCGFFLCNAAIAAVTAYMARSGDTALWTFYNGFLAYLLMGLLFLGELLVRRRVMAARRA